MDIEIFSFHFIKVRGQSTLTDANAVQVSPTVGNDNHSAENVNFLEGSAKKQEERLANDNLQVKNPLNNPSQDAIFVATCYTATPPKKQNVADATDVQCSSETSANITELVSPRDIIPVAQAGPRNTKKKRKVGSTSVITSSPYLAELKEEKQRHEVKDVKKVKKAEIKRKIVQQDSSESEENTYEDKLCDDSTDTEHFTFNEDENGTANKLTIEPTKELFVEDYVLVELKNDKTKKQFVAQILDTLRKGFEVKFMQEYRGNWNVFVFPDVSDISVITDTEIIEKLCHHKLRYGRIQFS